MLDKYTSKHQSARKEDDSRRREGEERKRERERRKERHAKRMEEELRQTLDNIYAQYDKSKVSRVKGSDADAVDEMSKAREAMLEMEREVFKSRKEAEKALETKNENIAVTLENAQAHIASLSASSLDAESVHQFIEDIYRWIVYDRNMRIRLPSVAGSNRTHTMLPEGAIVRTRNMGDNPTKEGERKLSSRVDIDTVSVVSSSAEYVHRPPPVPSHDVNSYMHADAMLSTEIQGYAMDNQLPMPPVDPRSGGVILPVRWGQETASQQSRSPSQPLPVMTPAALRPQVRATRMEPKIDYQDSVPGAARASILQRTIVAEPERVSMSPEPVAVKKKVVRKVRRVQPVEEELRAVDG